MTHWPVRKVAWLHKPSNEVFRCWERAGTEAEDATSRPAILGVCVFCGERPAGCFPSVCGPSTYRKSCRGTAGHLVIGNGVSGL